MHYTTATGFTGLKKKLIIILTVILIMAGAAVWLAIDLHRYAASPAGALGVHKTVIVPPGQGFKATLTTLNSQNIITDKRRFTLLARYKGVDKKIQAGEYELSGAMTVQKIIDVLVGGKVRLYKFTVPEGFNLRQIAQVIADAGLADAARFHEAATDKTLVQAMGLAADTFEGYLFPDTYHFPKGTQIRKIIATMLQRFQTVFKPQWHARAQELKLTPHQVVTMASIIEKETGAPAERPLIASVIHNRLKKRMRLEVDPTVIYGIPDFDGNLTRKHLRTRTPYNTYVIRGLPPGPIASPGAKALEAALYPAKTDFLYFVSKKDTTHHFSSNIRDHNRAVRKYQLRRKRNK